MQELSERISIALTKEEARAERFANRVRLLLLTVLATVALLNAWSVSPAANFMNFGALLTGYAYGFIVFIAIRRMGYRPMMKYVTSCLDILLLVLLLMLYARIEIPSVALKNYVFLIVFPLITLTAFRYDRGLTFLAGGLAVALYLLLVLYLTVSHSVTITGGGYERELFSSDITLIGQSTKILILVGFIFLMAYLAHYSRKLFVKLVSNELRVRNQKELMDWELNIASQVQNQFLPHSFPQLAGLEVYGTVRQGRYIGGDYFDFIKLADDSLLVVIADVSGKGVPAALIMAEVRACTHALASANSDLDVFTQRVNALLHQSTDKKSFVTFYAGRINTSNRLLTYINAGHPPPLLLSAGTVRSLKRGTIPLGVCASLHQLTTHTEEFPPGSTLVSFTDGLLEQTNRQADQFGEERLRAFAAAHAQSDAGSFARELLQEIRNFADGSELNDDVSISVVKHLATGDVPRKEIV